MKLTYKIHLAENNRRTKTVCGRYDRGNTNTALRMSVLKEFLLYDEENMCVNCVARAKELHLMTESKTMTTKFIDQD